jgi:hypothetical protein
MASVTANIKQSLNANFGCWNSKNIAGHAGKCRVFRLKSFPASKGIGLFENIKWRCSKILYCFGLFYSRRGVMDKSRCENSSNTVCRNIIGIRNIMDLSFERFIMLIIISMEILEVLLAIFGTPNLVILKIS